MSEPTQICKNCETAFQEGYGFCPHCGQKAKDELTLGILFYNTIANYFSFDARFLKSFLPLLFKPGYLAQKFIEGKRLLYLHPAQLYLFVSVVFFFLFSFNAREQARKLDKSLAESMQNERITDTLVNGVERDSIQLAKAEAKRVRDSIEIEGARKALKANSMWTGMSETQIDSLLNSKSFKNDKNKINIDGFETDKVDSLISAGSSDEEIYKIMGMKQDDGAFVKRLYSQGLKFYKSREGGSILQTFYDTVPIAMFFLLPIFAFLLKVFYRKSGQYAHHLVFSFYFFSYLFTVFSLLVGVNLIWPEFPGRITTLIMFSTFIYFFIAVKKFYRQPWFKTFVKTNVITFLFLLLVIPLTVTIIGVFAFLFY